MRLLPRLLPQTIRGEFALFALSLALPFVGLIGYGLYDRAIDEFAAAEAIAVRLAESNADRTAQYVASLRTTLEALARRPLVRVMDAARCDPRLTDLVDLHPRVGGFIVVDREGAILCSSQPLPRDRVPRIVDEEQRREMLADSGFRVSKPELSRVTGRWIVSVVQPVLGEDGALLGSVAAAIDLLQWRPFAPPEALPERATLAVVSLDGTIIARSVDAEKWIGVKLRDEPLLRRIAERREGAVHTTGADNVERIFGVSQVAALPWFMLAGLPESSVFAPARERLMQIGVLLLIVMGLVFAFSWGMVERLTSPIRGIAAAVRTRPEERGDGQIPVDGPLEVAGVARELNRMFEALSRRPSKKIEALEQQARDLAWSVETVRQRTLSQSNERIEALEQKARDLAWFVETTRQQALLQSDKKTEALEQKARDLADFVEALQNQTRLQSATEIEALAQQARDLALFVETVRKETRLKSETEIAALRQQARDLAVSVETVREETLFQSDTEIAALRQQARDLAVSVETVREETLLQSDTEIGALGQQARDLAVSVETVREETLLQSDTAIEALKQQARNLALSVEKSRIETLLQSDKVTRKLNEELEQRVLERTGQLEAANKELESFSYSVSHDLRAPLRAINGFSRILTEDYGDRLDDEARRVLGVIRDNSQKMAQLIDDLLEFSRLSRKPLSAAEINTKRLVEEVLDELQAGSEQRPQFTLGPLPPAYGDAVLIKQAWVNLLANAVKFSGKREQPLIEVSGHENGAQCVYCVKDNGTGFDMRYHEKLFNVFQRLHRQEEFEGTGVGLAIVQRIVSRHGGRVWAEGKVDEGAAFYFSLPKGGSDGSIRES